MKDEQTLKTSKTKGKQVNRGQHSFRRGRKEAKADRFDVTKNPHLKGPNDSSWRTNDAIATKLAANLPFGIPAGISETVDVNPITATSYPTWRFTQPGIMVLYSKITAGISNDFNSPVNLAARKIYSYVRHANSGSRNYEANDLLLYLLATGQAISMLGWLQRLYNVLLNFKTTNRYTPRALVYAMSGDYDDLIQHQAEMAWAIAWLGRALGSLALPKLPYYDACYEAYKYVYMDNDSPKEQYYVLSPYSIGVYSPTLTSVGGGLQYQLNIGGVDSRISGGSLTYASILQRIHSVMDVLLSDEDIGIISGDILKAYGDSGLWKPLAFGDYETVIKSEEMLQQFHNASVLSYDKLDLSLYEQQAGGTNTAPYLTSSIVNTTSTYQTRSSKCGLAGDFIDAFSREPSPEEVTNCLVLKTNCFNWIADPNDSSKALPDPSACSFDLFWIGGGATITLNGNTMVAKNLPDQFAAFFKFTPTMADMAGISNFDWHPLMFHAASTGSPLYIFGDIQNCRFFTPNIFHRVHENSMLGLLAYSDHNFGDPK